MCWHPLESTPRDVSIVFCCQIPCLFMGHFGGFDVTGKEGGDASGGGEEQGATAWPYWAWCEGPWLNFGIEKTIEISLKWHAFCTSASQFWWFLPKMQGLVGNWVGSSYSVAPRFRRFKTRSTNSPRNRRNFGQKFVKQMLVFMSINMLVW